jgi:hypothetical protein
MTPTLIVAVVGVAVLVLVAIIAGGSDRRC